MSIGGVSPFSESNRIKPIDITIRSEAPEPKPSEKPAESPTRELYIDTEPAYRLELSGKIPPEATEHQPAPEADGESTADEHASCETCESRRYVDRSDDSGVSYQVPTKLPSSVAAVKVAAHEREHVYNERADAQRDDAEVVSQSVRLKYAVCPECGTIHVAGGETKTTTTREVEAAYGGSKAGDIPESAYSVTA